MARAAKKDATVEDLKESLKVAKEAKKNGKDAAKALSKAKADMPAPVVVPQPKEASKPRVSRSAKYPDSWIVRMTPKGLDHNPKRQWATAWDMYELYSKDPKGMTVAAYVEAVKKLTNTKGPNRSEAGRAALKWDEGKELITVTEK